MAIKLGEVVGADEEGHTVPSDSVLVMLTRMEGTLALINQRMNTYERDLRHAHNRLDEMARTVSSLAMLDVPKHITQHETLATRVSELERDKEQRRGMASAVKVLWAVFGAGFVTVVYQILGHVKWEQLVK